MLLLHPKSFISTQQNGDCLSLKSLSAEKKEKVKPIWNDQENSWKLVYQRKNQIFSDILKKKITELSSFRVEMKILNELDEPFEPLEKL